MGSLVYFRRVIVFLEVGEARWSLVVSVLVFFGGGMELSAGSTGQDNILAT